MTTTPDLYLATAEKDQLKINSAIRQLIEARVLLLSKDSSGGNVLTTNPSDADVVIGGDIQVGGTALITGNVSTAGDLRLNSTKGIVWNSVSASLRDNTASVGGLQADGGNGFNFVVGTATSTAGVFKQITIIGSNNGTGAGAFIQADLGPSALLSWSLGNKSALFGTAFNSTTALATTSSFEFLVGASTAGTLDISAFNATGEVRATGDTGGAASTNALTGTSNLTANSTGVGTIKFKGATSRDSSGFIKIYIGTTAYYVPVFSAITG